MASTYVYLASAERDRTHAADASPKPIRRAFVNASSKGVQVTLKPYDGSASRNGSELGAIKLRYEAMTTANPISPQLLQRCASNSAKFKGSRCSRAKRPVAPQWLHVSSMI